MGPEDRFLPGAQNQPRSQLLENHQSRVDRKGPEGTAQEQTAKHGQFWQYKRRRETHKPDLGLLGVAAASPGESHLDHLRDRPRVHQEKQNNCGRVLPEGWALLLDHLVPEYLKDEAKEAVKKQYVVKLLMVSVGDEDLWEAHENCDQGAGPNQAVEVLKAVGVDLTLQVGAVRAQR